ETPSYEIGANLNNKMNKDQCVLTDNMPEKVGKEETTLKTCFSINEESERSVPMLRPAQELESQTKFRVSIQPKHVKEPIYVNCKSHFEAIKYKPLKTSFSINNAWETYVEMRPLALSQSLPELDKEPKFKVSEPGQQPTDVTCESHCEAFACNYLSASQSKSRSEC
ncbi:hypothetical protein BgiBS90_013046, partial [Biomphalaria glabrata]